MVDESGDMAFAAVLTSSSARVAPEVAQRLLAELYGIEGSLRALVGERDDNFLVDAADGRYLLKIVHPAEASNVTDLVTCVLGHLAAVDGVTAQLIHPTLDGQDVARVELDGAVRAVRLTSYIPGRMLHTVAPGRGLERGLGVMLARLGEALASFRHPAAERDILWDIWHAGRVRFMLDDLAGTPDLPLLAEVLDRFDDVVRPRLARLRRQMVHNDVSGDNVVVAEHDSRVVGIIDFGDATVTNLVNDVAIAMTNRLVDGDDPLAAAIEILRGYHATVPLEPAELELLYDLIRTRTTMRIIISEWRSRRFPDNHAYVMRNTPRARTHLRLLTAQDGPRVTDRLIAACAAEAP